jgi:hypothetical protein
MNMKKQVLSAAIVATLGVGSAQAVHLSADGTGEVLIFPYYTVENGNKTLLSVVNTTNRIKAVKVRFREGMNSREVLDFNLYLSPFDVWVGSVEEGDDGGAKIVTGDTSCTAPVIPDDGEPFRTYEFDGNTDAGADGGTTDISRVREGYIEIIEMGVDDPSSAQWGLIWDRNGSPGVADVVHVAGVPDACQTVIENFSSSTYWGSPNTANNYDVALAAPTGGLFGSAAVINVQSGTEISVEPTVLDAFSDRVIHRYPGTTAPTLADVTPPESFVTYLRGLPGAEYPVSLKESWGGAKIDAVSAVIMAQSVKNEYTVNPATEASTSWVITFPTKWAYADGIPGDGGRQAADPFTNDFTEVEVGKAPEAVTRGYYDREESSPVISQNLDFSPSPILDTSYTLDYEVNVLAFGSSVDDVFGSQNLVKEFDLEEGFVSGWAGIHFQTAPDGLGHAGHHLVSPSTGNAYAGLPVIGFRATVLGNSNVGVGASYGVSDMHKYMRHVTTLADANGDGFPDALAAGGSLTDLYNDAAVLNEFSGL